MNNDFDKTATIAAAALGADVPDTGDLAPQIKPATTYDRDKGYLYYRNTGPGMEDAERVLCALDRGAAALLFSSGMAAATGFLIALGPGAHIVAPKSMYWLLRNWMMTDAADFGLSFTQVDNGDISAIATAIQPGKTKAVWIETPANPDWSITDIAAAADVAHTHGAVLAVDSTSAPPPLTRCLDFGADVVMHSATKYLNGHSDVLAGVLITKAQDALWDRVTRTRTNLGATLGAFEAWLLLRGLRTLDVRIKQHSKNALYLATALADHPSVSHVLYPGLPGHPGHAIATKQMAGGFGGMMSIRLKGGAEAAARTATRTRLFRDATSLGGVESLIEHRGPIEGSDSPTPQDLLRLSVGLEDADDLLADLEQALGQ